MKVFPIALEFFQDKSIPMHFVKDLKTPTDKPPLAKYKFFLLIYWWWNFP